MSEMTLRETVVAILTDSTQLADLGLPTDAVYQADTLDTPTEYPFVVIRWRQEQLGVGPVAKRPFDLWWYDSPGSYSRIDKLGRAAQTILGSVEQMATVDGNILRIETRPNLNNSGLGRGDDLFDDGWDAVVIPWSCSAVATGS